MNLITLTDKEIWNELRSGNHQALEHIYSMYFNFLFAYGKKIASEQSMVEDAIQELFIELWQRRTGLSETDSIQPYLTVALKRKLFKSLEKAKKTTSLEEKENQFGSEDAMEQLMIKKEGNTEKSKELEKAIQQLSARQQEIIYLKFFSGMDYEEIADIMDMNYQSARNLVHRAITKLGKFFIWIIAMAILFTS